MYHGDDRPYRDPMGNYPPGYPGPYGPRCSCGNPNPPYGCPMGPGGCQMGGYGGPPYGGGSSSSAKKDEEPIELSRTEKVIGFIVVGAIFSGVGWVVYRGVSDLISIFNA